MIAWGSYLEVLDNSGARLVKCIGFVGWGNSKYAYAGDEIMVSVWKVLPGKKVVKGMLSRAVIVQVKKEKARRGGDFAKFSKNMVVMVKKDGLPLGTRVLGPVMQELRKKGFIKVISLATVTI